MDRSITYRSLNASYQMTLGSDTHLKIWRLNRVTQSYQELYDIHCTEEVMHNASAEAFTAQSFTLQYW